MAELVGKVVFSKVNIDAEPGKQSHVGKTDSGKQSRDGEDNLMYDEIEEDAESDAEDEDVEDEDAEEDDDEVVEDDEDDDEMDEEYAKFIAITRKHQQERGKHSDLL